MKRLDQALVERGLAPSRTRARDMIEAGQVTVDGHSVAKPSHEVGDTQAIHVQAGPADRFVSRGGLKLENALAGAGLDPRGWRVLDVGQSTGGFTDCLLQKGAVAVIGIDVGHAQVHPKLRADARVTVLEGLHVRDLPENELVVMEAKKGFDLAVMDLSFISMTAALPSLARIVAEGTPLLALVKPQFEVGPEGLGKGGLVRDPLLYGAVESKIKEAAVNSGWQVRAYFPSSLEGKDGNKEFFLHAVKN